MENGKIKNIIILALVFLNLFLFVGMLLERSERLEAEEATEAQLRLILESVGLETAEDIDFFREPPKKYTLVRDSKTELDKMDSLLGGGTGSEDLGGNVFYYYSAGGQASLRGTGQTDVIFNGRSIRDGGNPEKASARILNRAGLEVDRSTAVTTGDEDNLSVTLCCAWEGYPVYNARLTLDYSGSKLLMMTGTRVFDLPGYSDSDGVMDCVSAVMRFVEIMQSEGIICSRIENVEAGYIMSVTVSGESGLTPVWKIVTDTGTVHINAITGKTETV